MQGASSKFTQFTCECLQFISRPASLNIDRLVVRHLDNGHMKSAIIFYWLVISPWNFDMLLGEPGSTHPRKIIEKCIKHLSEYLTYAVFAMRLSNPKPQLLTWIAFSADKFYTYFLSVPSDFLFHVKPPLPPSTGCGACLSSPPLVSAPCYCQRGGTVCEGDCMSHVDRALSTEPLVALDSPDARINWP